MLANRAWKNSESQKGYFFIFVCLDHLTKFVILEPMRKDNADNVIKCLEHEVFHVSGVPEFARSDNGKQFISNIFREVLFKYGVEHIHIAFYVSQTNGAERVNQSILEMI